MNLVQNTVEYGIKLTQFKTHLSYILNYCNYPYYLIIVINGIVIYQ